MGALPDRDLDHILEHTRDLWYDVRGKNLFLTGGTGFVGTWLVESFVWANTRLGLNAQAVVLSRNPPPTGYPSVHFVAGDARSFAFPSGEFPFVIHASTEKQTEPTPERPASMFDADVESTRRVLEFARTHGTRRFLFTSSGAAYGKQPPHLTHLPEDYAGAPSTVDPLSAYGHAKRTGEWLVTMHARQYGFDALLPRLFAFVGPHLPLDRNFAVGNFIGDVLRGGSIRIGGDGTPSRSYLYAADLAIWLWTILLRGEPGRIYNVGSPHAVTIAELAHAVVRATGVDARIEIAQKPTPGAPASRYVPDTRLAEEELGLYPWIDLEDGIRRTFLFARSLLLLKTPVHHQLSD